ncbi:MAG: hypothetical protein G01um101425_2 [Candidatus Peregrinibacteria bacterium Gr01-1014_25]|nr:MAG: hypothetical protein G01um101425_2 [Candidatus Peregrinibacteria bacterium Gr01-1014_25]
MLQRLRESLTLVLLVALPFHALAVTLATKLIAGPGHAPMGVLAVWKEGLLGVILCITIVELFLRWRAMGYGLWAMGMDIIDALVLGLLLLAVIVSAHSSQLTAHSFFYGFKYDFIPLLAFLVLRRVPWSDRWQLSAVRCLLALGVLIAAYGIVTMFLPMSFFTLLGYSDLHSLYLPDGPLAAFQQVGASGIRRIQSTFSGPNQLGLWLLLPWGMVWAVSGQRSAHSARMLVVARFLLLAALFLTFSRAAWIGAVVIIVLSRLFPLPPFFPLSPRERGNERERVGVKSIIVALVIGLAVALAVPASRVILLRSASTTDHLRRPMEALRVIADHPFGLGLGSAGPASNRVSDGCVFLPASGDASWAAGRDDLCVFLGDVQVQPRGRVCRCPLLPENWYLQIGVELGVLGLALYLVLMGCVLVRLWRSVVSGQWSTDLFAIFLALSLAALVLHAFEDSAVAYTAWILVAAALPIASRREPA